jgi:hypothetical protein
MEGCSENHAIPSLPGLCRGRELRGGFLELDAAAIEPQDFARARRLASARAAGWRAPTACGRSIAADGAGDGIARAAEGAQTVPRAESSCY